MCGELVALPMRNEDTMNQVFCLCGHRFVLLFPLILLAATGCGAPTEKDGSSTGDDEGEVTSGPLTVIVLDDKPLGKAIKRQWTAHSESEVKILDLSSTEFVSAKDRPSADVVIYSTGLLGEFVERDLIRPIPQQVLEHESVQWRDMLPFDRGANVSWDNRVYAFSFGSPTYVLFYRSDLFESLGLEVPKTWSEYQELAENLNDRASLGKLTPDADARWSATVEPLAPGWAGQMLLARAAAYARHPSRYSTLFNYTSMEPLIDRKPFVKALDELVASSAFGPANHAKLTPAFAREAILSGHCAMAISWPVSDQADRRADRPKKSFPVSTSVLPGSDETFNFSDDQWQKRKGKDRHVPLLGVSGRLGSVLKDASNGRGALNMLARLTNMELGTVVATQSEHTAMFRASHIDRPESWVGQRIDAQAAQRYALAFQKEQESTIWLYSIRIPGRLQFLDALDEAVGRVIVGGESSSDSLKTAAGRWREINESDGRTIESQRRAYEKSLGL